LENTTLQDVADFKRKVDLLPGGGLAVEIVEVTEQPTEPLGDA